MTSLIEFVDVRSDDIIVTLGDYIDRGPDSRAVVDFVIELGKSKELIPLRGNHEIMLLDSREKQSWLHSWMQYGGEATLRSYSAIEGELGTFEDIPVAHLDFFENELLPYYECESHFFVHANVDSRLSLDRQSDASLYWKRYDDPEPHCSGKIMVCGHTPQLSGWPSGNAHSICIDTWAHGGGWLSCLDVGSGTVWQANEAGETRSFALSRMPVARTDRQN